MGRRRVTRRQARGFTLIETIAVVAILGLLIAIVVPGIGTLSGRRLRTRAQALAETLELARLRTVMTGVPHRVHLDLDAASWRLEWLASDAEERGEQAPPPPTLDLKSSLPLDLSAPKSAAASFRPLPGLLGNEEVLEDELSFQGVKTEDGFASRGEADVAFETDGAAPYTEILLRDDSGHGLVIELLPLADLVRVNDAQP